MARTQALALLLIAALLPAAALPIAPHGPSDSRVDPRGGAALVHRAATAGREDAPLDVAFGFDFLHLVQEWPGSFCDSKQGCVWPTDQPVLGWLLHGLWPEFNNGTWPQYCDAAAPFNASALTDLLPELEAYWPSLMSKDFPAFWAHEWTRHGTCCEALTPQEHGYFALVLHLRETFDAFAILDAAGIHPGMNTTLGAVQGAIRATTGVAVEVGCNRAKDGTIQLYEIRACFAPMPSAKAGTPPASLVKALDCAKAADVSSCGGPHTPIHLPMFPHAAPVRPKARAQRALAAVAAK